MRILQMTFSKSFSWIRMYEFRLKCIWSVFLNVYSTIFQHWFWYWLGADQAWNQCMKQWWLVYSWWRHQMEAFSALLALCAGNSPVPGEFPAQRPVTRSCDVFLDLRLNKRLSKQSWGWWFETQSGSLWRHCNADAYSVPMGWLLCLTSWR